MTIIKLLLKMNAKYNALSVLSSKPIVTLLWSPLSVTNLQETRADDNYPIYKTGSCCWYLKVEVAQGETGGEGLKNTNKYCSGRKENTPRGERIQQQWLDWRKIFLWI